jgi:hypothetical protein
MVAQGMADDSTDRRKRRGHSTEFATCILLLTCVVNVSFHWHFPVKINVVLYGPILVIFRWYNIINVIALLLSY